MIVTFKSNISYVVNMYDIQIIDRQTNQAITLGYPEAAVFDLLIKEYPCEKIIQMISYIVHCAKSHAESILNDTLNKLIQKNFIRQG